MYDSEELRLEIRRDHRLVIDGNPVAMIEIFLWGELDNEQLEEAVRFTLARLTSGALAVVLVDVSSINHTSYETRSFGHRLLRHLDQLNITAGIYNPRTWTYDIMYSHHPGWPPGVMPDPTSKTRANGKSRTGTPARQSVSLHDCGSELTELTRLLQLLERPNQSGKKRERRRSRVAELRHKLGLTTA